MANGDTVEIEWKGKRGTIPRSRLADYQADGAKLLTAPPSAPGAGEDFARTFNVSATGSETFSDLWQAFQRLRGRIGATDPIQALLIDPLEEMGEQQVSEVQKRQGPLKVLAAVPFVGPRLTDIATEKDPAKAWAKFLGTVMGAGILSKAPELPGQALSAGEEVAALARRTGQAVEPRLKELARQPVGAGEATVKRARTAVEEKAAERQAAYDKRLEEFNAAEAAKVEKAQAKHAEKTAETKRGYGQAVSQADRERIAASRLESRRVSFERLKDKLAEEFTGNVDKAEAAERASLDERWQRFRESLRGVKQDLAPLGEAVVEAKENILKGSETSIPIFNSILGELKNLVEGPQGELKPVPGQNFAEADQLQGYITELGDKMYGGNLPGDVYRAMKHVRETAIQLVRDMVTDHLGKDAATAYRQLRADWSDYENTWRDKTSGSPLVPILSRLRASLATKMDVPVYRRVGDLLTGKTGEQAIAALARKRNFGADPRLAARVRWADSQMKAVPKPGKVTAAERPEFPRYKPPEPGKAPEAPEAERFDPETFRREQIGAEVERLRRLTGWDVAAFGYAIEELARGLPPWGLSYPVGKRLIANILAHPSVTDWLAREGPAPALRAKGASSGINPQGMEASMRPATQEQKVQALRVHLEDLRDALRRIPASHPERELLLSRQKETEEVIRDYEAGKVH